MNWRSLSALALFIAHAWLATPVFFVLPAVAEQTETESYPNRLVRIVHLYTTGGGNDVVARLLANDLSAKWNSNVIVEPRPGGAGIIGTDFVAKSPADGYTLLLASDAIAIMPSLGALPFNMPDSFAPITLVGTVPFVLIASNNAPFKSFEEMLSFARARPGKVAYASVGVGSPHHLNMELLKARTGIDLVHVPYRGAAPQIQDIVAGQVPVGFSSMSAAIELIRSGSIRALAVSTLQRVPLLPDVPTISEMGLPDFEAQGWYGLLAPAGTPEAIVNRINTDVSTILSSDQVGEKLSAQGIVRTSQSDPPSFTTLIKREAAMWKELVAARNLQLK